MPRLLVLCLTAAVAVMTDRCSAAVIDLAPPPSTYASETFQGGWVAGGVGGHRAVIFEDTAAFNLNAAGIEINPSGTTTLTAAIYQIIGSDTVGALLASSSAPVVDAGRGFYDVALNFSFAGTGSRYMLDFSWVPIPEEATYYSFEGLGDFGAPIDPFYVVGPVRVIDGKDGFSPGEDNFILAHFRMDIEQADPAAPEPATLALMGVGGIGLVGGAIRRRRRVAG